MVSWYVALYEVADDGNGLHTRRFRLVVKQGSRLFGGGTKHGANPSVSYSSRNLTRGRTLTMATKLERLPQVEVVKPPAPGADAQTDYDLIFPIGAGSRGKWMNEINTIFLTGVPRALRRYPWVYLKQGHNIFWAAPIEEILSDSERISWITGADHGSGPSLIIDLYRGEQIDIDAAALPTPDNQPWHDKQGFKYVTPGCTEYVKVGPKPPTGAARSRSSIEVALERALGRHIPVDRDARSLRLLDGKPYPVLEVDICIPDLGLVVEYDGSYWHQCKEQHDSRKTARLLHAGLRVIRVRDNLPSLDVGETVTLTGHKSTPDDMARDILDQIEGAEVST